MAIPHGPAGRPKKKSEPAPANHDEEQRPVPQHPEPQRTEPQPTVAHQPVVQRPEPVRPARRTTDRVPSEILPRDGFLSPVVLGLSLEDFFDLHYQDALQLADLTVEDFFRMRDNHAFPDPFTAGDARSLFTEDICRRGQFVPVGWHQEGMYFATCKPEGSQDDLAKALDLLVKLPVTLYTVSAEQLEGGIGWLFRK
jgi:hypothetical protein